MIMNKKYFNEYERDMKGKYYPPWAKAPGWITCNDLKARSVYVLEVEAMLAINKMLKIAIMLHIFSWWNSFG